MPISFLHAPRLTALATLYLAAAAHAAPTWITIGDDALAVMQRVTPAARVLSSTEVSVQVPQARGSLQLSDFQNRRHDSSHGVAASNWLFNQWQTPGRGRRDVRVSQVTHAGWPQKSVSFEIEGTGNGGQTIILGAHLDAIAPGGVETARAPGADDDASGVLQLDMTAYRGDATDLWIYTDYTDAGQNQFLVNLARTYLPELSVGYDRCGYGCSDHASWFNKGYIASLPFEASNTTYNFNLHTTRDTIATFGNQADHALKFARLALAYAVELASDGAPVTVPVTSGKP